MRFHSNRLAPLVSLTALCCISACDFLIGAPAAQSPAAQPSAEVTPEPVASAPAPEPVASVASSVSTPPPDPPIEPGVQPTPGPTRGTLPKAAVSAGVAEGNSAFEACYLKAARPGLRGTILVNFVVTRDGSVPHAAALEEGTDFEDDAVIECVLKAFKKLHFQAPAADRAVITYPLKFEPSNDAR